MIVTIESSLEKNYEDDKISGFRLGFKTKKRKLHLQATREDDSMSELGFFHSGTTPSGGKYGILNLPFNVRVQVSEGPRPTYLVGFPAYLDVDGMISGLEETFNYLAIGALKYQSKYSYTDESKRLKEYEEVISELAGDHLEDESEMTKEEFEHMVDTDIIDLLSCRCELCVAPRKRNSERQARNEEKKVKARERFLKVLPFLWD